MNKKKCSRCGEEISDSSYLEIDTITYCFECAKIVRESEKEKKRQVNKEKTKIVKDREKLEKELIIVAEDDTKHIIVTTTNNVESKRIGEYIDIISVQEYKYQEYYLNPVDDNALVKKTPAEKDTRACMELALSDLKKQAYLVGADAVIGVRINSSFDYDVRGKEMVITMNKVNISGTAVRLLESY
ncbi:MAG: heavy metal-binding domain-containing protein [Thermodesulfobacteriota bacterium]|nr:heavy metal-binding domain-containing protein [Thermodesulfobacteriota bacterium]